jgi:hypothetical protein
VSTPQSVLGVVIWRRLSSHRHKGVGALEKFLGPKLRIVPHGTFVTFLYKYVTIVSSVLYKNMDICQVIALLYPAKSKAIGLLFLPIVNR